MILKEFNQYKKYLGDHKFMSYFNEINDKVKNMFPYIDPNLELVIDKINLLYHEKYTIDDAINKLYLSGNIFKFYSNIGDV